jgi:PPOX class probable F420-dependent enzyme
MLDLTNKRAAHVDARLRSDLMLWLSTVKPDGTPHIVPVWFLWDGEFFYIYSKPDQKIRNLQQNNAVMLALDDTKGGSDPIWVSGEAALLPREEALTTKPAYVSKYQTLLDRSNWTGESMAQDYTEPIKITPRKFFGI